MGRGNDRLMAAIERDESEEAVHVCMAESPIRDVLPQLFGWSASNAIVESKPSLHTLIPDFAVGHLVKSTQLHEWALIEIERPSMKLFTQNGDPTANLTHAVHQVTSWRNWIVNNIAYARTILPDIGPAFSGVVIIGRRDSLNGAREGLAAFNHTLLNVKVRTYDWVVDKAEELGV